MLSPEKMPDTKIWSRGEVPHRTDSGAASQLPRLDPHHPRLPDRGRASRYPLTPTLALFASLPQDTPPTQ
jgi:hypothetical protein